MGVNHATFQLHGASPGTLLRAGRDGLDIACGAGALRVRVLQREGGKAITAADYLNARRDLRVGACCSPAHSAA